MRIVCSKCGAAYAIEDRLIGKAGVRAQCPRCKNQELVRRGEGGTRPEPPPGVPSPMRQEPVGRPASGALPRCSGCGKSLDDPFDQALGACDSCRNAPPKPAAGAGGSRPRFGDLLKDAEALPLDTSAPPGAVSGGKLPLARGPAESPRAPGPAVADPFDLSAPDGEPDPFDLAMGAAPSPPGPPADPLDAGLSGPPPLPADPFEVAPSASPDPFARMSFGPPAEPSEGRAGAAAPSPAAAVRGKAAAPTVPLDTGDPFPPGPAPSAGTDPFDPSDLSGPSRGPPQAPDPVRPAGTPLARMTPAAGVSPEPRVRPPPAAVREARYASLKLVESRGGPWKLIVAAVAGLGVASAAAFFLLPGVRSKEPREAPLPEAVVRVQPRWGLLFVDLSEPAEAYLARGQARLGADEPLAYGEAEEAFQQALLRDPQRDEPIVGYVQALALGRRTEVDDETFQEALALVRAAEQRSGRTAPVLTAHAHLLLSRPLQEGHRARARTLAEEAVQKATPAERGQALLALGRAYLDTSAGLAAQHLGEALATPTPPLAAWYYRALAYVAEGQYRRAIADLKKRLEITPGHSDALETLARVYQECGVADEARTAYARARQRHPEDLRFAVLHLAFAYQVDGENRLAAAGLRTLLADADRFDRRVASLGFVHLAAVERLLGNIAASDAAARRALSYRPDATGAALQLFLNALDRRDAKVARSQLEAISGRTGAPALEALLAARLFLLEEKPKEAAEACRRGFEQDPRRLDALICAGVTLVHAGRADEGFRLLYQAALADPLRTAPAPVVSRIFVPDTELLGAFAGLLSLSAVGEDLRAVLHEGAIDFRLHRLGSADEQLREVLSRDEQNPLAHAYRALIALQRREVAAARRSVDAALHSGKLMGVVQFTNGEVLAAERKSELAERAFAEAITLAPGLLAAEVSLARLETLRGQLEGARDRLRRVIARDPSYLPAKRVLYTLQDGG